MILFTNNRYSKKSCISLLKNSNNLFHHDNDDIIIKGINMNSLISYISEETEVKQTYIYQEVHLCVVSLYKEDNTIRKKNIDKISSSVIGEASIDIFSTCFILLCRKIGNCFPSNKLKEIKLPRGIIVYCIHSATNVIIDNHSICRMIMNCLFKELMTISSCLKKDHVDSTSILVIKGIMRKYLDKSNSDNNEWKLEEKKLHYPEKNNNITSYNDNSNKTNYPILDKLEKSIPYTSDASLKECAYMSRIVINMLKEHNTSFAYIIYAISEWLLLLQI